jgi:hypothetical protein
MRSTCREVLLCCLILDVQEYLTLIRLFASVPLPDAISWVSAFALNNNVRRAVRRGEIFRKPLLKTDRAPIFEAVEGPQHLLAKHSNWARFVTTPVRSIDRQELVAQWTRRSLCQETQDLAHIAFP